uniref:aromatic ring-hydroxylating dioxygenase subunit alpha n=1 Tax=Pararhizobium sp. IMCC3301 TaxID=3067904 RepID=UPI002741F22B|nr:aromatic ring-hydroxylating dioxygenase subunit alpha [Pararhizobium sp. IMCC3301]
MTISDVARNQWYPVAIENLLNRERPENVVLMGEQLTVRRSADDTVLVTSTDGQDCPVTLAYGHVWSSIGTPGHALFDIPEADEPGRRMVDCGAVRVKASPLRVVENFLDIAHFPFVHTDVLGAEPHTEVEPYKVEIRDTVDEVWATKVRFFQPQAAKSAGEGQMTDYMYRVPAPCVSILYKTCPPRPGAWDVIALFVRPISEVLCDAYAWMALYDDDSAQSDLIQFQQMIFLQDRSILENQLPRLLPLDPKMEIPTRADTTSIAYRRWLKRQGMVYGAQLVAR